MNFVGYQYQKERMNEQPIGDEWQDLSNGRFSAEDE
jgi:hypothetical protein